MSSNYEYVLSLRDRVSPALERIGAKLARTDTYMGAVRSSVNGLSSAFSTLGKTTFYLNQIGQFAGGLADKSMGFVRMTADAQALDGAIRFAAGGALEAEKSMAFLKDTAQRLGLDMYATKEGFKTLSGAMMGSRLQGDATRKIFEQVSYGAVAMGLSAEDTKAAFLALGQMMGKGKVQAEELRGQLGERIPGAFQIAARAMGVTTAQLDSMLQSGSVMAEDFLPKFGAEMERTFKKGAEAASGGLGANINRLNNAMSALAQAAGTTLTPALISAFQGATAVLQVFERNMGALTAVANDIGVAFAPIWHIFEDVFGGGSLSFQSFIDGLRQGAMMIAPFISATAENIHPILEVLRSIAVAIYQGLSPAFQAWSGMMMAIQPYLSQMVSSLAANIDWAGWFSDAIHILTLVMQALTPWISAVLQLLAPLWDVLTRVAGAVLWVIRVIAKLLTLAVAVPFLLLGKAAEWAAGVVAWVVNGLRDTLQYLGLISSKADEMRAKADNASRARVENLSVVKAYTEGAKQLSVGGVKDAALGFVQDTLKKVNENAQKTTALGAGNTMGGANTAPQDVSSSLRGVSGGGQKQTHITIQEVKFADTVSITPATVREGAGDIQAMFEDMLLRVLNSSQQIAE